ncbi:MAG: hypothetical protein SOU27_08240 [Sodaliphilus sp.]|nr:hypothetical protein [Sodaliphilus sp.]
MAHNFTKWLTALLLMAVSTLTASATDLVDVVYLKNGSVIRGTLLEAAPEGNIRIETADGNLFVYRTDEVAYIAKEKKDEKGKKYSDNKHFSFDDEQYGWEKAPRYRGFAGYTFTVGTGDEIHNYNRITLFTTHGCQINPYLFVGAGMGATYWDDETWSYPIYADVRTEIHNAFRRNFSPYLEVKTGYSVGDANGFYFSPSVGFHFYFGHTNMGLSVAIGYSMQYADDDFMDYDYYDNNYWSGGKQNYDGLNFSVSFDF